MYKIQHAGLKGFAVFATQRLAAGTRIFAEKPLISVSKATDVLHYLRRLPIERRNAFLGLSGGASRPGAGLLWIEAGWQTAKETLRRLASRPQEGTTWPKVSDYLTARSIFLSNNFALSTEPPERAVFPTVSRLNHACVPNAQGNWNARIDAFTVHTVRDVKVGEEITLSYLADHGALAEERQAVLAGFKFRCECPACQMDLERAKLGEVRRSHVKKQIKAFAEDAQGGDESVAEEFEVMRAMLSMYEQEGISGRELSTMYIAAAWMASKLNLLEEAAAFARRGLHLDALSVGTDSPLYESSLRAVEALQIAPLHHIDVNSQPTAAAGSGEIAIR